MILLDKSKYVRIRESFKQATINVLFARSVVEQHVTGKVYVDNIKEPRTSYVIHPYGMSLLFGEANNQEFNSQFLDYALNLYNVRYNDEWMQAFPDSWDSTLAILFKDEITRSSNNLGKGEKKKIELNTRCNFKFNTNKFLDFRRKIINKDFKIVRTDMKIFENMKGSVVPLRFWNNAKQFYNSGIGFSMFYEQKLASTAFSSYIHENQLEIGIETIENYRGIGLAKHTCSTLIDYCLEHGYEPIWSCRLENIGSYKLAQELGFEPTLTVPYYRLSN
ncbi:MAG: GNAT family N-acetyltransferase [Cyclobacteriaceae bacterium]